MKSGRIAIRAHKNEPAETFSDGRARRVRVAEGPARRVRSTKLDYPFGFGGRDEHAPPTTLSEGPACRVRLEGRARRVRRIRFDNPSCFIGHDKRAPVIVSRKDVLVTFDAPRSIVHSALASTTGALPSFA